MTLLPADEFHTQTRAMASPSIRHTNFGDGTVSATGCGVEEDRRRSGFGLGSERPGAGVSAVHQLVFVSQLRVSATIRLPFIEDCRIDPS